MTKVHRSLEYDQHEILASIRELHLGGEMYEADITYGNGSFWQAEQPPLCFDKQPLAPHVVEADSTALPVGTATLRSVVFDPPFLTYVRAGREGNGRMAMARRFAGYWTYGELETHYRGTLAEVSRVLRHKGLAVVKCQDIVHNHRLHCTHASVIQWAAAEGLRLVDLYVLGARHRLPAPNRNGVQKHARIFHSYFLVFRKMGATEQVVA
jgi:hypothetical protein